MEDKFEPKRTMRIDVHPDFSEQISGVKGEYIKLRTIKGERGIEYNKLLQSIYDAVLVTSYDGIICELNRRVLNLFKCKEEDLLGLSIIKLISGAEDDLLRTIHETLLEHRYTLIEAHCIRFDNTMFPAEIAVNRIDLDEDRQLCFFVRDITIRKKTQQALEEMVAKLEAHDRARSQFIFNVSHELRTPLTSMIFTISNLLRGIAGEITPEIKRYLTLLESDTKRLLSTVNDILDLRKIESNTLSLSKACVPIARVVMRSAESLRFQAQHKGLVFETMGEKPSPFVECDVQKIERVVVNIVGNAVKFTQPGGRVWISVRRYKTEKERKVFIEVGDTGPGIPQKALPHVTERYFTLGDQASGTGLGLSISKEIVELHGGKLEIFSPVPGESCGTLVRVILDESESPLIVIVDDDESVLKVMKAQLEGAGYKVEEAFTGEEAISKIWEKKPRVVILDQALPDMKGTDIILRMKGDKAQCRVPVIVVTGANIDSTAAHVLRSFAIPVLGKPWTEIELLEFIEGAFLGEALLSR